MYNKFFKIITFFDLNVKYFLHLRPMPLDNFPIPKTDTRFSFPNPYGIDPVIYSAIINTVNSGTTNAVQLTDAANIDTNSSLGVNFYVTLEGNRNMSAPTNASDWKIIRYYISQDGIGSRTLTWNAVFRFSTDIPSPTLTTTLYFSDYVEFMYNPTYLTWDCIRVVKGFDSTPL